MQLDGIINGLVRAPGGYLLRHNGINLPKNIEASAWRMIAANNAIVFVMGRITIKDFCAKFGNDTIIATTGYWVATSIAFIFHKISVAKK